MREEGVDRKEAYERVSALKKTLRDELAAVKVDLLSSPVQPSPSAGPHYTFTSPQKYWGWIAR